MSRIRPLSLILFVGLLTSACTGGADPTDSPSVSVTASAGATQSATPSGSPAESPTEEPTPAPTESPSPTLTELPGGFTVHANAEADTLFLDRDTCSNERDNYEISFPDAWFTNTEIGRNPACVWFAPTDYDVPDPSVVPDEIAITIEWMDSDFGSLEQMLWNEEVLVGAQQAVRAEWAGAQGEGGQMPPEWRMYGYQIQLGPTPEEGPNIVVLTTNARGGDYELNKAVMDRMMATIEFFGSID
jgi:hypothetical protein